MVVTSIMNIASAETSVIVVAKTCGCTENRRVSYTINQGYHDLCLGKKEIVSAQLEACERLLKYASERSDRVALEQEIRELRMALDLMT
jgi:hypothetical protein